MFCKGGVDGHILVLPFVFFFLLFDNWFHLNLIFDQEEEH